MADWDKIYQSFNKGGKDWQKINDGIMPQCFINGISPLFIEFISKTNFKNKHVFDIGCGNGKYLVFLSALGWQTDGIDHSKTSVDMTKQALGDKAGDIKQADMLKIELPTDKYDLIISISTINHCFKADLSKLINKIYAALLKNGKTFITIPDKNCLQTWKTFQKHKKLDDNTATPLIGPEKGIPHSFYTTDEIKQMFAQFKHLDMKQDESGQWLVMATK